MPEHEVSQLDLEIPLAEMVQTLRSELVSAQAQAKGEKIQFELDKIELELKVLVSRAAKGGGGIKFWVLTAEGGYEKRNEASHTIKLTLNAKDSQSQAKVLVSGETSGKVRED